METINNVVNTVSGTVTKAIYGEQQTATGNETAGYEPVSGVQGKGTATEPYDQGNSEDPTDPTTRNETAGKEPVSGLQGKGAATEPFDQGNSADATNTTGTTSLPIREKSSLENTANIPDLSAKPTIPTSDAFNSATAANASTAAQTSTFTSRETDTEGKLLGGGSIGSGDAGVSHTKNLSDTLSKTEDPTGISSATGSSEPKSLSTTDATDGPKTPGLAGFGDKPRIDPSDQSQIPTTVSNITSGSESKAIGDGDAGVSGTKNLSETLSKTEDPTSTGDNGKHTAPFTGDTSANAQKAAAPDAAPVDVSMSTDTPAAKDAKSDTSAGKETERVVESTRKDEASGTAAATKKEDSPTGEKEKVSKMEKLKEKLHIGHKH